jgi:taurine dioxygenase
MPRRILQPVGVEITGLDLRRVGPDDVTLLRDLLAEHGVVVMPGQEIDDDAFRTLIRAAVALNMAK